MFIDAPEVGSEERVNARFVDLSQELLSQLCAPAINIDSPLHIEPRIDNGRFSIADVEPNAVLPELCENREAMFTTCYGDPSPVWDDSVGRRYLTRLAEVLRDKSQWPEGFKWGFSQYATCAMGLSLAVFGIQIEFSHILTTADVEAIFYDGIFGVRTKWAQRLVTPNMVARRIERYLAHTNA